MERLFLGSSDNKPQIVGNQTVFYRSSEHMAELSDESIDLVLTSPPYGTIKDYDHLDQIGFFDDFDQYISRLSRVWKECFRVLKPGCRLVINIGDQYLRAKTHGRYRILPIGAAITHSCQAIEFDFLGDIIWKKVSTTQTTGGGSLMGSVFYPRNGLVTYDYEHILIFKKLGKAKGVNSVVKEKSKICLDEWKNWFIGHWTIPGVRQSDHIAMFPEEIPYRIIRMFTFINDTVLDPFVGSGTTLKVAMALQRKGIGYEINSGFRKVQERKIKEGKELIFYDFQLLSTSLIESATINKIKILFERQHRRGFSIFEANDSKKKYLVDLLMCNSEFTANDLTQKISHKIKETHISNILSSSQDKLADYVIMTLKGLSEDFQLQDTVLDAENIFLIRIENFIHLTVAGDLVKFFERFNEQSKTIISNDLSKKRDLSSYLDRI